MEKIKQMEEQLSSMIQTQLCNPEKVDAKELGEVVDILKDLSEFCYYKTITKAMEEGEGDYNGGKAYYAPQRQQEQMEGRMYYNGNSNGGNGRSSSNYGMPNRGMTPAYYTPDMVREYEYMPEYMMPRDPREGRARDSRRMYMESKEIHRDSATQMRELEKYLKDLSQDITEIVSDATQEEKRILQEKIETLAQKIM